ncbi:MAG TPA: hypothetical protein VMP41_12990 [Acidimicrobiales bacterium]|nr:hypothetical protein [Acidimicrobiales bacterium]
MAKHPKSDVARPRPDTAARWRLRLTAGTVAIAAMSLATGVAGLPSGPAGAKSTTTTTKAAHHGTTTTTAGHKPSAADTWLLKAIDAEAKIGSVRIDGKIQQNKTVIYLDLVVNADGEGGGTFIQNGFNIELERVGTLLYFNAPKKYWQKTATAAQANTYGGKWLEISALDARFVSFDQFLDADDLVFAAFEGHSTPLTMGKPTTFQGHKVVVVQETVVSNGKRATGSMYIGSTGKPVVYKIVNDSPNNKSTIVFSRYGKAVPLTVPPNAINLT